MYKMRMIIYLCCLFNAATPEETTPCQNGLIWNGMNCECQDYYSGPFCEYVADIIEIETIEATVNVSVRIISEKYSDNLKNNTSNEFKSFSQEFEKMNTIYRDIKGYKELRITSIRNGSLIVDHEIIINRTNSAEFSPEKLTDAVEKIVKNLTIITCTNSIEGNCSGFEFDSSQATVQEAVITDDCGSLVPKNLKQYYKLILTNPKPICASICHEARNDPVKCGNGKCGMTNNGPKCYCDMTDVYWYFGGSCNILIHKNGLISGLSVAVILLLLGHLALTVYKAWFQKATKQRLGKREDERNKIIKWEDGNSEWHNPEAITVANREAIGFDRNTNILY
ncbi:mucin-17-like [Mustelus asterias]